jgi:hypothetical protein
MMSMTWNRFVRLIRNPDCQLALVLVVVLFSRVPFLDAGYGVNVDAWRVARVAREIATTGQYSVSRFPGYPVQEIVCSWFWRGGPVALNGLTAFFSLVAVAAFMWISRKLRCRDAWLAGLALAVTPIFFVSSACAKDYIWALAFVLLSVLCALDGRALFAGVLLGLGAGCRITSLAMMLPLTLILFGETSGRSRWLSIVTFISVAAATAALVFSPVWLSYGMNFLTFYENHARPDWVTILKRGTVEIWGVAGLIGLCIAASSLFLRRTSTTSPNKWVAPAFVLAIAIYLGAYLRLPDQAGYLLPIVPFVLILAQQFVARRLFQILCACLFISSFAVVSQNGLSRGPIFADHVERLETMARIRGFLAYSKTLPGRNTFVVGGWEPQIAVMASEFRTDRNRYVYLLTANELSDAFKNSDHVFYLPLIREFNYRVTGLDLAQHGALDLRAIFDSQQAAREQAR